MFPATTTCAVKADAELPDRGFTDVATLRRSFVTTHHTEPERPHSPEPWKEPVPAATLSGATSIPQQFEVASFVPCPPSGILSLFLVPDVDVPRAAAELPPNRDFPEYRRRQLAAVDLLNEWLADDSGYDERTWPQLKKDIEENRSSYRRRFGD